MKADILRFGPALELVPQLGGSTLLSLLLLLRVFCINDKCGSEPIPSSLDPPKITPIALVGTCLRNTVQIWRESRPIQV